MYNQYMKSRKIASLCPWEGASQHTGWADAKEGSLRTHTYVTMCGLVPSSVRSYLGAQKDDNNTRSAVESATERT